MKPVYLDYNASSPLDPRVAEVMLPILTKRKGNASSSHGFGQQQMSFVSEARDLVASLVARDPLKVLFTAGATESNNIALQGLVIGNPGRHSRVLISAVEHASIFKTAKWLDSCGLAKLEVIPVTQEGFVDLDSMESIIGDDVVLVSVMSANSETGVLNPIKQVAKMAHSVGALMHCDVTQSVGRIPFDLHNMEVDLVSFSSHKICGPAGVGALVGTRETFRRLRPIIHGGGQENGLRSGSLNVAGIAGFGEAAKIAVQERVSESSRLARLRDMLTANLKSKLNGVFEVGSTTHRLANTTNIRFAGADAEAVVSNMDPVAVSTGSACGSGSIDPSHVLLAMGIPYNEAFQCVRFSLGRFSTLEEINDAVDRTVESVTRVREMYRSGV